MKPTIKEEDLRVFVDLCDIIEFISDNAPMEWNATNDFIQQHGIAYGSDRDFYFYDVEDVEELEGEEKYWIGEFFKAHPFITKGMVVVFTD